MHFCKTSSALKRGFFMRKKYCSSYNGFVHLGSRILIMFGSVCYVAKSFTRINVQRCRNGVEFGIKIISRVISF